MIMANTDQIQKWCVMLKYMFGNIVITRRLIYDSPFSVGEVQHNMWNVPIEISCNSNK